MTSTSKPALLWKHFRALSAIPRVSKNEKAAADYVESQARRLGFSSQRDQAGNVLVQKPASPGLEARPGVILQSHLDMVPQKNAHSAHDFSRDPLRLIEDGEWLHADNTTLGADNGMGVAAALALLEDEQVRHGPLAALFTVEEEIGLLGAAQVKADFLPGKYLINLDADLPEELIIGCAGAANIRGEIACERSEVPGSWLGMRLRVSGLCGGHSGADIHKGRANALRLAARVLSQLCSRDFCVLASLGGGDARNAIPREAVALLALPPRLLDRALKLVEQCNAELRNELAQVEPALRVTAELSDRPIQAITEDSATRLLTLLRTCPSGVIRFSDTHPGIVETSNNLAIVSLGSDSPARVQCLARGIIDSAKTETAESIAALMRMAGGTVEVYGSYPGWQPALGSDLLPVCIEVCGEVLDKKPNAAVVHGGLECGILRAARPELDCISIGPRIEAMHSPDERVHIGSVADFYKILSELLPRL